MPDLLTVKYRLDLRCDYHVGTGFGLPGVADSVIFSDARGQLPIPGDTIKGIVRHAAERLMDIQGRARCDGTMEAGGRLCGVNFSPGPPFCPICYVFGSPFQDHPRFHFQSADPDPAVADWLTAPALREDAVRLQTEIDARTARDPFTRRAREDHLFNLQVGRYPYDRYGEVREVWPASPPRGRDELALLIAALRFARRLGAEKSRGLGACRLTNVSIESEASSKDWAELVRHFTRGGGGDAPS